MGAKTRHTAAYGDKERIGKVQPVEEYHGLYGQVSFFAMVGGNSVKALCLKCSYGYKQVNVTNTYE